MEKNYDFRKRLLVIHEKDVRDAKRTATAEEYILPDTVVIGILGSYTDVTETAVYDYIDYLQTSMHISARMAIGEENADIKVSLAEDAKVDLGECASYKGFRIDTDDKGIKIYGFDERGIGQALYYMEALMNFEKAPVMKKGSVSKKPMFAPRMIHSGYGCDNFPDEYIARVAHEGRDALLVFTCDLDKTRHGYLDFNGLIERARKYGVDVYAYSFMTSNMSPEAPEAEAFYENTYGKLFRNCPGLKGVTLVGESVEFPSKDPHVAKGRYFETAVDGIPAGKPSSGWYPCYDYPIWLNLLKKVVRKYNADADIVFWSYNWGGQPEEARVELIKNLPTDISLQATFEMFEPKFYGDIEGRCCDYTLSFEGPGKYFASEAKVAKERGIRLYSMTNTGGLTWDFGVIPYEPFPYQWMRRYENMIKANREWGLVGLMESHHFGFTPSFISKLSNLCFLEPLDDMNEILEKILKSEFGEENYALVNEAMINWSEAIRCYSPSNENQYGSFRVGPSYPMCLLSRIQIPADPKAMFGNSIIDPQVSFAYSPKAGVPYSIRVHGEIEYLYKMLDYIKKGLELMEAAPCKNDKLDELINLGNFLEKYIITGINAKTLQSLRHKLLASEDKEEILTITDAIEQLIKDEMANAESAIPFVEKDSRLGWEPSMEYMTDKWHIEWKLRQCQYVLDKEIPTIRKATACIKD